MKEKLGLDTFPLGKGGREEDGKEGKREGERKTCKCYFLNLAEDTKKISKAPWGLVEYLPGMLGRVPTWNAQRPVF